MIVLRDSTLREGLDVPGLKFSMAEQLRLVRTLSALGIREIEIGAPGRARQAHELHRRIKEMGLPLKTSGLVFGFGGRSAAPAPEAPMMPQKTCADLDDDGDGINNCNDKCPGSMAGQAIGPDGCPVPEPEPVMEPKPFRG